MAPEQVREVVQPEDKLKAGMKERIVASVVIAHEHCEEGVDKRLKFEDRIKRTYFHVKPLELKQLKNWEAYLDFEIAEGDHERTVVLFERCLIPCALYEQFWIKYARYMETHLKTEPDKSGKPQQQDVQSLSVSPLKRARWSFGTGLLKVDEIREKRCTWTLKGWMRKDEEGNEYMVADDDTDMPKKDKQTAAAADKDEDQLMHEEDEAEKEKDEEKEDDDIVNTFFEREIGK